MYGRRALALSLSATLVASVMMLTGSNATFAAEPDTPSASAPSPADRPDPLVVTAGGTDTARGGDLISLTRPVTVRSTRTLGSHWSNVPVTSSSAIPDSLTGSVLISVSSSSARRSGSVYVRPKGSTGSGALALSHSTKAINNLSLVKIGTNGSIQIRAGSASPRVAVTILGWVPTTASLAVPENPLTLPNVSASTSTRTVRISGKYGVPSGATSVLVGVRTSKARTGTLALWTRGSRTPSRGIAFTSATQSSFAVVRPDASGNISLKALSGRATVTLQVLGWSSGATTLQAPSKPTGPRLTSTSKYSLKLAGSSGISSSATAVAVTVNAPKGWRVKVWSTASTRSPLVLSTVSTGAAVQVWVRVPSNKTIAIQAKAPSKTRATASVLLGGYTDATGGQLLSVKPKAGTHLLSSGDVLAERAGGVVDLAASSGGAKVGDYLFIRSAKSAPYLGLVTASEPLAGGKTRATLQSVRSLSEAFDEYDAHFAGTITDRQGVASTVFGGDSAQGRVDAVSGPSSIGLSFFESGNWSCSGAIDPAQIITVRVAYEGKVNLDISLSEQSIDFSSKGGVSLTFTFLGGASVACTVSGELPFAVPIGATGMVLKFGGEGVVQVSGADAENNGTFSLTGGIRTFAGFYYINGEKGGTGVANPFADFRTGDDGEVSGQIDLGVTIGVGLADVPLVPEPYDISAGMTLGVSFRVQPPSASDDPLNRTMRGPHCIDLTATPFVKFGGQVAIVLAPDLSFEFDPIEGDPKTLYAGPCYGYTGTITFVSNLENTPAGCTAEHCQIQRTWKRTLTKTLIGQAADFGRFHDAIVGAWGAPISQPYTWNFSQNDYAKWTHDPCWAGLPCGDKVCETSITANGSGIVAWNPENPTAAWFLDGYDYPSHARSSGSVYGATVQEKTTLLSGETQYCGDSSVADVSPAGSDLSSEAELDPRLIDRPVIDLTLTGQWNQWHPELTFTTTVKLTRKEFPR